MRNFQASRELLLGGGGGVSPISLVHHLSDRAGEGVKGVFPPPPPPHTHTHEGAFAIFTLKWSDLVHTRGDCGPYLTVCFFAGEGGRANPLATGLNFNIKCRPHFKENKVCIIYSNIMKSTRTENEKHYPNAINDCLFMNLNSLTFINAVLARN